MSTIEWTQETWNPTIGCRRVSAGCDNCYAISVAHRFKDQATHPHYAGVTRNDGERVDWTGVYNVAPDHILNKPLSAKKPTMYFVNSMSDLFGEGVDDATIKRVFAIMNATPQHTYQVLTKRPNRAAKMADSLSWTPNIWMGTSIELDKFSNRARELRKIPAAVRFLSCEPLLGPLPSLDLRGIDWVIVGGESGPGSRPMEIDWARDLRDRCNELGVAYFFKQWGNWGPTGVRNRGKKDAGRELDGRLWEEMPVPRPRAWEGISTFRQELHHDRFEAAYMPVERDGVRVRVALREAIKTVLSEGPRQAAHLRAGSCAVLGVDPDDATITNLNAWALVDLQRKGLVAKTMMETGGYTKTGRAITVPVYALREAAQ